MGVEYVWIVFIQVRIAFEQVQIAFEVLRSSGECSQNCATTQLPWAPPKKTIPNPGFYQHSGSCQSSAILSFHH